MGSPTLYWMPQGTTTVRSLVLGARLSDLQITETRDAVDAVTMGGLPVRSDFGGVRRLSLSIERRSFAGSESLVYELQSLATYLQSGGVVGLVADAAKVYGGWCEAMPSAGDASVTVSTGNAFTSYASGTLAVGDFVSIESPNPECLREFRKITALSGTSDRTLTLSGGVLQTYATGPVFVRYHRFWPLLMLDPSRLDSAAMQTDRWITASWELDLIEYPGLMAAAYDQIDAILTDSGASPSGVTLAGLAGLGVGSAGRSVLGGYSYGLGAFRGGGKGGAW